MLLFAGGALANDTTGTWQGSWTSNYGGAGGLLTTVTQTGSSINGSLTVTDTDCGTFSNLAISGTISGSIATLQSSSTCYLDGSSVSLQFANAFLAGNSMTGVYTILADGVFFDSGTFSLTRATNLITASAGAGGTISPSGAVAVVAGTNQSFTIVPAAGHSILDVLVNGVSVGATTSHTFFGVSANHTIDARFVENWTIAASAGANGTIVPSGSVSVPPGSSQVFSIGASPGFLVADVRVDGASVGAVTSYEFTNVTADHTIEVRVIAVAEVLAPILQLLSD